MAVLHVKIRIKCCYKNIFCYYQQYLYAKGNIKRYDALRHIFLHATGLTTYKKFNIRHF